MPKSKTVLLYKVCFFFLIFTFLFVWYQNRKEPISVYSSKDTVFKGYIDSIQVEDDILTIFLHAKENLLLKYVLKTKEEKEKVKEYKLGSFIKVKGTLEKVETNRNFNMFSYRKYLWSKKVYRKCNIDEIITYKENTKILYHIKNRIIDKINVSSNKAYYFTFLLGDTSYLKKEVKESYLINGISHLFAISGMHISLFSIFLLTILKKIFSKEFICYLLCILFLFFYAFLTSFTPSVLRSTLFFTLLFIKHFFSLKIDNVILYIFLTCFFLLYNPYFIYHTGFLYSFTISFFLICFGKKFCKKRFLFDLFSLSFLSFLASFPIQINTNFEINMASVFLNILFVPLVSKVIFPLTLLCFFLPIDFLLSPFLSLLEHLSLLCSHFSFLLIFPRMNSFEITLYYLFLLFLLFYFPKKVYLLFIFFLYLYCKPIFTPSFLTMIDVGQGDSLFLHSASKNILIDTGGKMNYFGKKQEYDKGKEILLYLKSRGIRKIDTIFLTHGDYDHMGDAIYLVENFKVEKVILNCGPHNDLENELIKVLKKKSINYSSCIKELNFDNNKLYFLNTKEYDNENDNSSVIYTELNNYKFLFMGDASILTEKEIIDNYNLPNIDVLKVGHHGSKTSSSKEFINTINPKYSIISVGKNNKFGHPNKEVLDNLKDSKIYRTDIDGSIMFKIKKSKLEIATCSP